MGHFNSSYAKLPEGSLKNSSNMWKNRWILGRPFNRLHAVDLDRDFVAGWKACRLKTYMEVLEVFTVPANCALWNPNYKESKSNIFGVSSTIPNTPPTFFGTWQSPTYFWSFHHGNIRLTQTGPRVPALRVQWRAHSEVQPDSPRLRVKNHRFYPLVMTNHWKTIGKP